MSFREAKRIGAEKIAYTSLKRILSRNDLLQTK